MSLYFTEINAGIFLEKAQYQFNLTQVLYFIPLVTLPTFVPYCDTINAIL